MSDTDDILDKKYTLYIRYPDGYEVTHADISLLHIRHMSIRQVEHRYRPEFLQVTPKVSKEHWEYLSLEMKLHPSLRVGTKNGS